MGDAINTAARLESVNKHLGTRVCISETSVNRCSGFKFRPVGNLVLKGKTDSVKVFEPHIEGSAQNAGLREYQNAYNLMENQSAEALEAFKLLSLNHPDDPLVIFHRDRFERGETGATIVMKEK